MGRDKPMKHKYKTGKEASRAPKPKTSISPTTVIPSNPMPSRVHRTIHVDAWRTVSESAFDDVTTSEVSSPPSTETLSLSICKDLTLVIRLLIYRNPRY
ncbi:hypothetical protein CRE_16282 [Caenorhabditis remanei]|uniref:Uncharacterized protein n=1 Tax=Caenorhabditis remanei TaxID=31234 RepID=E3N2I8_CAERE|nr:hypothetical protein CRE_16282 [Caenorhabditis remanei]